MKNYEKDYSGLNVEIVRCNAVVHKKEHEACVCELIGKVIPLTQRIFGDLYSVGNKTVILFLEAELI